MLRTKTFMLYKYKYLYLYLTVEQEASQVLDYVSDQNIALVSLVGMGFLRKPSFYLIIYMKKKNKSIFCAN